MINKKALYQHYIEQLDLYFPKEIRTYNSATG